MRGNGVERIFNENFEVMTFLTENLEVMKFLNESFEVIKFLNLLEIVKIDEISYKNRENGFEGVNLILNEIFEVMIFLMKILRL